MMPGSCLLTGRRYPHNIPCNHAHRARLVNPVCGQPKPTTGQRVTHSLCIQISISPSKHCGFGPWLASCNTGKKVTTTKSDWASPAYKISLWVLPLWVVSMIISSIIPASLLKHLKPITLLYTHFLYTTATIEVYRIKKVLPKIISNNQTSFLVGYRGKYHLNG